MLRLLVLICLVATPALAQTQITLTSQYGPEKPQTLLWKRFADIVETNAPGTLDPVIVTNGALGGEKEEAEAIRLGTITGALSTAANLTTWVPEGAVLDLPFVFQGREHIARVLDGRFGDELKAAYRREGFVVPAFIVFGARHLMADKPLAEPADVTGLTMRVLQSDLHVELWRSLGANPSALPITEAYAALANGVVDAMDLTKSGYEALKIYEVAPVLTETRHIWAIGVVYFDAAFWDGLDEDTRTLFASAAQASAAYFNALTAKEQDAAMQRAVDNGARLVKVDATMWREATADFVDDFVADMANADAEFGLAAIRAAGQRDETARTWRPDAESDE